MFKVKHVFRRGMGIVHLGSLLVKVIEMAVGGPQQVTSALRIYVAINAFGHIDSSEFRCVTWP